MEQKRFLMSVPNTYGRYALTCFGDVLDCGGESLNHVEVVDGRVCLQIDDQSIHLKVATIVAICAHGVSLHPEQWRAIEPLFIDANPNNLDPSNVSYRFAGEPIEVQDYPGFYHVPFFTNYGIDRSGNLVSLKTGHRVTWTVSAPVPKKKILGGYRIANLKKDTGGRASVSRHRLLCLTFKSYEADLKKQVVNHINGVPGDDWLDNLEWTTYSGNTKHAYETGLHSEKVRPVLMWDMNTDTVTRFDTIVKCYTTIGQDENFIRRRLAKKKVGKRYSDGLVFKYDDGKPWPEYDQYSDSRGYRFVMARNVFTGEVSVYNSQSDAANALEIKRENITNHMKASAICPTGGFVFRWASDHVVWPKYTELQLELYRHSPRPGKMGVLAEWPATGRCELFPSVIAAAKAFGKGDLVIHRLASSGKIHRKGGFRCSYVDPNIEY